MYNTSSTTTVLSHLVGDTNMESCTRPNHHNNNTNTSRARICFKALVIIYTQRERDINTPRAHLSFLGDSPNWGNPKTNAKGEFFAALHIRAHLLSLKRARKRQRVISVLIRSAFIANNECDNVGRRINSRKAFLLVSCLCVGVRFSPLKQHGTRLRVGEI